MPDDFRIPVGFFQHPKTVKLRRRLGGDAVIAFQQLIEFCAKTDGRHQGSLAGMSAEDIAISGLWDGDAETFVTTLRELRFLDGEPGALQMHEFEVHQPYIAGHDARSDAARHAAEIRWGVRPRARKRKHADKPDPDDSQDDEGQKPSGNAKVTPMRIDAGRMPGAQARNAPSFLPSFHPSFRRRALRAQEAAYRARGARCDSATEGVEPHDSAPKWRGPGRETKQLLLDLGLGVQT